MEVVYKYKNRFKSFDGKNAEDRGLQFAKLKRSVKNEVWEKEVIKPVVKKENVVKPNEIPSDKGTRKKSKATLSSENRLEE